MFELANQDQIVQRALIDRFTSENSNGFSLKSFSVRLRLPLLVFLHVFFLSRKAPDKEHALYVNQINRFMGIRQVNEIN